MSFLMYLSIISFKIFILLECYKRYVSFVLFKDIQFSKEPPVFPLEKLLLSILQDARASLEVVRMVN